MEVFTNEIGTDEILIHVGSKNPVSDKEDEIKDHFRAKLRVTPMIKFETDESIQMIQFPGTNRKPIKFIDNMDKSKNNW